MCVYNFSEAYGHEKDENQSLGLIKCSGGVVLQQNNT